MKYKKIIIWMVATVSTIILGIFINGWINNEIDKRFEYYLSNASRNLDNKNNELEDRFKRLEDKFNEYQNIFEIKLKELEKTKALSIKGPIIITKIESDLSNLRKALHLNEDNSVENKYVNTEIKEQFYKIFIDLYQQVKGLYQNYRYIDDKSLNISWPSLPEKDFKNIYEKFSKLYDIKEKNNDEFKDIVTVTFGLHSLEQNVKELESFFIPEK